MVFDMFTINGSLKTRKGTYLRDNKTLLPTNDKGVMITIKELCEILCDERDGINNARHISTYNNAENKWFNRELNRFNISRFLMDYAEGNIPRTSAVRTLNEDKKKELIELANRYAKFDRTFNRTVTKKKERILATSSTEVKETRGQMEVITHVKKK